MKFSLVFREQVSAAWMLRLSPHGRVHGVLWSQYQGEQLLMQVALEPRAC
ncbi:hypothetical protein [Shewanella sp. 30m-9]